MFFPVFLSEFLDSKRDFAGRQRLDEGLCDIIIPYYALRYTQTLDANGLSPRAEKILEDRIQFNHVALPEGNHSQRHSKALIHPYSSFNVYITIIHIHYKMNKDVYYILYIYYIIYIPSNDSDHLKTHTHPSHREKCWLHLADSFFGALPLLDRCPARRSVPRCRRNSYGCTMTSRSSTTRPGLGLGFGGDVEIREESMGAGAAGAR